jgi:hypothetical protein
MVLKYFEIGQPEIFLLFPYYFIICFQLLRHYVGLRIEPCDWGILMTRVVIVIVHTCVHVIIFIQWKRGMSL